jgi:hypothetical protein
MLSVRAAQPASPDVPAGVRIGYDLAKFIDIRRLVRSEQESFGLERHRF